jgi:predicted aspartyl protease
MFLKIPLLTILCMLLLGCNTGISKANLRIEETARIDNLLISEIVSQDFDAIKITTEDSKYMVNVRINNIPEKMLLDTGAAFTFMKSESNKKFLLKEMGFSGGNKPNIKTITNDEIENLTPAVADTLNIGKTVLKPWPFILSNEFVIDTLGCDFMHFTEAVFICNPGVLLFSTNHTPVKKIGDFLKNNGYREIELLMAKEQKYVNIRHQLKDKYETLNSGVLLVPVIIDNISGFCVVDTGGYATFVNSSRIDKKYWEIKSFQDNYFRDAKGNKKRVQTIKLDEFVVGNIDLGKNVEVGFLEMQGKQYINPKNEEIAILGNIGVDFLYEYNAIIDFGNRKLYLRDKY